MGRIFLNGTQMGKIMLNGVEYNAGSSGDSAYERLCYVEYVMHDAVEIPTISSIDTSTDYADYLSYDSTTKKFTVLQDFTAIITAWVEQERTANNAKGEFYINDVKILGTFITARDGGSKSGETRAVNLKQNDTFYSYTPSGSGWPEQRLKVYKTETMPVSDLYSFTDEKNA